jgi:hypothetical protein
MNFEKAVLRKTFDELKNSYKTLKLTGQLSSLRSILYFNLNQ